MQVLSFQGRVDANRGADQCEGRPPKQSLSKGLKVKPCRLLLLHQLCVGGEVYVPEVWSVRLPSEARRPLCLAVEHHQREGQLFEHYHY